MRIVFADRIWPIVILHRLRSLPSPVYASIAHTYYISETSPEFWQMSNMEYLQWGYGVCSYVLSIEYEHGIFVLGVGDMHHYHCWVGGQRCCQIYQGVQVVPLNTQYSILYPWTLTPEP